MSVAILSSNKINFILEWFPIVSLHKFAPVSSTTINEILKDCLCSGDSCDV